MQNVSVGRGHVKPLKSSKVLDEEMNSPTLDKVCKHRKKTIKNYVSAWETEGVKNRQIASTDEFFVMWSSRGGLRMRNIWESNQDGVKHVHQEY